MKIKDMNCGIGMRWLNVLAVINAVNVMSIKPEKKKKTFEALTGF